MTHKNRQRRAAKKEREFAEARVNYEEAYGDEEEYEDEDEAPARKRRGPHPALIALIVIVVVLAGGFFGLNYVYDDALKPIEAGNEESVSVEIPQGASTSLIATLLKNQGLIKNELVFKLHCKWSEYDGRFNFGTYALNRGMSADEIAQALMQTSARADTKTFTIPEGLTIAEVAKKLAEQDIVSESEFYKAVEYGDFDYAFLADCPAGSERLEGFLYPETYEVYADATARDVVSKMLSQFAALWKPEYDARASELGMSVRDVVTMGSIIERESIAAEERPMMAGVFYNRIRQGMRLESCATIEYILGEGHKEFLTNADLAIESPYNTYLNEGLPPGPICNPRIASVEAALYPDDNDYVFFVLSDALNGTHKFSADYNEFLRNKDAYYAAINKR